MDTKNYVKTILYNGIVEIIGDDNEEISYEAIEALINNSIDLVDMVSWNCAIEFVKNDITKVIKENKENEVPNV